MYLCVKEKHMAYTPAGNGQAQLPQSTVKFYDKKFRENLKAQTPFIACSERLDLPRNAGNQYEINSYAWSKINVPYLKQYHAISVDI